MVQPFVSNLISNKYDTALDFHVTMYDEMPYQRDSDYCNREKVTMHSNSLIKYYVYMFDQISEIDNGDGIIEAYLSELLYDQANQYNLPSGRHQADSGDDGVTEEQIQTLLDDNGNPMNPADEPVVTTNPFADVEDW